jgi:hypothetical protein
VDKEHKTVRGKNIISEKMVRGIEETASSLAPVSHAFPELADHIFLHVEAT